MKTVIIGGGPAGMMSAISAAENRSPKDEVIIVEKMNMLGKKLLITGKGRCNITSSLEMEDFIKNTPGNGMFLYSSFQQFTNKDIINFLKKQGLEVKEERGSRIFPITDKSTDVLNCFINRLKELKVKIYLNENVEQIITQKTEEEQKVIGIKTNKRKIEADKVILATGGKSYPLTGSTGEGYKMAKELGHTITEIKPSLVPLETYEVEKELQGLSLKNVKIQLKDLTCPKVLKIHDFVEEYAKNEDYIFLIGEKKHPEVIGTASFCGRNSTIIENEEELDEALKIIKKECEEKNKKNIYNIETKKDTEDKAKIENLITRKLVVVAQTTFNLERFKKFESKIREELKDKIEIIINNTICDATR